MFKLRLLSLEETLAVAAEAAASANRPPFDPTRALDALSRDAIISMVVLVGQLDGIASAAARTEDAWRRAADGEGDAQSAADTATDLIRQLTAAGYLPLPEPQEPSHGQG